MQIIDAQLHEIGPRLQWDPKDTPTRRKLLTELMLAWMDAVGVHATIVHPTDTEWGLEALKTVPDRFALVVPARDPLAADIGEQVAKWRGIKGVVATRLSMGRLPADPTGAEGESRFRSGKFDPLFSACERNGLPLFCSAYGFTHLVGEVAKKYPKLKLSVDHMGIAQPPLNERPSPPWRDLPALLEVAQYPNVFVKLCGAPVLSDGGYPYDDVWPHLRKIVDTFGAERVMWASDIGRFEGRIGWENHYPEAHKDYKGKHNYAESLLFIRSTGKLSAAEKEQILRGAILRFTGWTG